MRGDCGEREQTVERTVRSFIELTNQKTGISNEPPLSSATPKEGLRGLAQGLVSSLNLPYVLRSQLTRLQSQLLRLNELTQPSPSVSFMAFTDVKRLSAVGEFVEFTQH